MVMIREFKNNSNIAAEIREKRHPRRVDFQQQIFPGDD
jgi:hypothetical protein